MSRMNALRSLNEHAWYRGIYSKLSAENFILATSFIRDNASLNTLEFEFAVNRLFLDMEPKPKNWKETMECLMAANTIANQDS